MTQHMPPAELRERSRKEENGVAAAYERPTLEKGPRLAEVAAQPVGSSVPV